MSLRSSVTLSVALCAALAGSAGSARAEGIVQNAAKNAVKGAVKGATQEMNSGDFTKGAKQVTKGVLDGVADSAPMVTSQIVNQANVNKKALGKVARQVTTEAVAGAFGATMSEMKHELGPNGDGPLAKTMAATSERVTAASVRGLMSEIHVDTQKLAADAVRGALSEMHFNIHPWMLLLMFILGGLSTFVFGVGLMLMYLLFQNRRPPAGQPAVMPVRSATS